jgi:hypothetical protein
VANGFAAGAQTFGALARDPQALRQTIAETPLTLETGTTALRNTRPFLRSLTGTARSLRLAATELRRTAPPLTAALGAGLAPLRATPPFSARLRGTFVSLEELARSPGSDMGVAGLDETLTTLRPLTRFLGPYATVCNYWNYTWSNLSEHITDRDQTGEVERIRAKNANGTPQAGYAQLGQAQPVPGYHNEFYSHAVTRSGEADCEGGQRGYLYHVAKGIDPSVPIAIDPHTPGVQGTTFTGRPRVPRGETFTNR